MAAIRLIQKQENGQITFTVPDEMRNETIIIEFRLVQDEERTSLAEVSQQLFNQLPDTNPDFDWETLNVYEQ
ncbi:hypothetical protein [Spirosoma utsteinense]|uniref:Uncharacterized protein n=1 Tax=Spirosoma utsteinense TaxID=2585773 RepID=A0ABR6WC84_9BACT|nr:hypothetical protein [Spirosoma utsteinense]MBC3783851.1 hypothetical protein [Spirosoma utsteinense]MBC3793570.1 hypothetical protein [Spirosoma utsteinense]